MKRFSAVFLTILLCGELAAQPSHYFTWYGSESNQSLKTVHQIAQDSEGFIWLATWDGLLRFDGYDFTRYVLPPDRMTNRFINLFTGGGDILTATYDGCLYRFDRETSTFVQIGLGDAVPATFRSRGSHLYIVSTDGRVLDVAPGDGGEYSATELPTPEGVRVRDIFIRSDGTMWLLCNRGAFCDGRSPFDAEVYCAAESGPDMYFGAEDGQLYRYSEGIVERFPLHIASRITDISPIPGRNELLVSTSAMEVLTVGIDGKVYSRLRSDSFPAGGVIRTDTDSNGNLWVSSSTGGIDWYDPDGRRLVPFYDPSVQQPWNSENRATAVFCDRQGILWAGTNWNGLMKSVFTSDRFYLKVPSGTAAGSVNPENSVRSLMEDRDGNIWAGTKDGRVHIYDSRLEYLGDIAESGKILRRRGANLGSVYSMVQAPDGTVYMGTRHDGLLEARYKSETEYSLKRYRADGDSYYGLNGSEIFNLDLDTAGRLWIASFDDGLSYLDLSDPERRFISKKNRLHFPTESLNRLRFVTHDSSGKIYACGTLGMFVCDNGDAKPEEMQFSHYLMNSSDSLSSNVRDVQHINVGKRGEIYVSTYGGGFYRFPDEQIGGRGALLSQFTTASVQDAAGNLWIVTDAGLNKYNPRSGSIEGFSYERLGYKVRFNEGTGLLASDGKIYLNTSGGILYFDPAEISNSSYRPEIILKLQDPDPGIRDEIKAKFQAMDLTDPVQIVYFYSLDGGEWVNIGNRRSITLPAQKPGKHTLTLRSTNSNGVETANDTSVSFTVHSPSWASWWAICIYLGLAAAASGLLLWHRWKKRQAEEPYYGRLYGADRKFVKEMVEYIHAHIEEPELDVPRIASAMNVSRSRLFEKTKALLDTSPAAIIREIRFMRAEELIRAGEHSLSEVAYLSGFNDTHYFSTAFKQRYGMTPGEFRKKL